VTLLYIAALKDHLKVVQCLAQQGAEKEKATKNSFTPLCIAAQERHLAVVQWLV
jgi:ankyrin repeat protein